MIPPDPRIEAFFHEALSRAPEERQAFVTKACAGDESLQREVQRLLDAHEEAGTYFERPNSPEIEAELARLKPEEAGEWIGPYKLMEQIGQGGFGTVWVADQERPVRRRVALKIVKLGMDTKEVIARFEQERQALTMMDHPHIAKVLDAGATQWGRPFFVMELVRGIKITDYCDEANLSTTERLESFIQVCHAMQHAHQKGIIHRDLKPSNILVTLHDGVPVPKVIDFGVAKATQRQRLTDLTVYTQFQQMIGTPLYMSPEQAEMSGLDLDTRSDIYSLGVLLYELLTGRTPYDPEKLMKAGIDEMRRVIREQEPQTPSMALKTMAADRRASVAQHRRADAAKLTNLLRGDLDWIVMKALEKERARRYETANAFASDIQRHLTNAPVLARPPSATYLFKKHIVRHQAAYAAAVVALLAILAALVTGMKISRVSPAELVRPSATPAKVPAAPTPVPLRPVSGIVTSENGGLPLSNVLVRVASPSTDMRQVRRGDPNIHEVRTDRDGRFSIPIPPAETISLDALLPGYGSASGTIMSASRLNPSSVPYSASQPQEVPLKLAPALYVAGVVVDEEGRPFFRAEVEATLRDNSGYGYVKFDETTLAGYFEIFDFPLKPREGEEGRLTFQHPNMLRSVIDDVYPLSETARKTLRVVLRRGHDITGIVTSAGGRPAPNTLIEAVPADPNAQYKQRLTDADGRYVLKGLPDGEIVVRVHSVKLEQKAQATVQMAGTNLEVNLRLEPVVLKNPPSLVSLLGMKLADITPELKSAYGLSDRAKGVLIVDPGEHHERLGIGSLEEGEYFWIVGDKGIANMREMVDELLRINALEPKGGWITEGHRGYIRVVYSNRHRSNTQYLKLTDDDAAGLQKLATTLREKPSKE